MSEGNTPKISKKVLLKIQQNLENTLQFPCDVRLFHGKIGHDSSESEPFHEQIKSKTEQNDSKKLGPFQVLRLPYTIRLQ